MIKIVNLSKKYIVNKEDFFALENINIEIEKGEFVMIVGSSGSGKSTLLQIMALLDDEYEGNYYIKGYDTKCISKTKIEQFRQDDVHLLLQENNLLPFLTAGENVYLPLTYKHLPYSRNKSLEFLKQVSMERWVNSYPKQLSGGMRQKIVLARCLAINPEVILADEPTGSIDEKSTMEIMDMFQRLNKQGKTIVMVTHDLKLTKYAQRVIRLEKGHVVS